jgi:hypothetical protein
MQKFSSWINRVFLENANPTQLIATLQQNLATAQQDITTKNGLLQKLQNLSKSNPAGLNSPQLMAALQTATQKNDFKNLITQVAELEKQKPQPKQQPAQQNQQQQQQGQQNQGNQQQGQQNQGTPQAVPAPPTGAAQPQRK